MTLPEAMNQAVAHHQAGRLAEAEALYRRVLLQQKDSTDANNLLGVVFYQRGQNDEAVKWIRRAIAKSPSTAQYHFNLALVKAAQGKWDEAIQSCQRTLELNPQFSAVYPTMGSSLYCAGRFDEAIVCLEKAVDQAPEDAVTRTHLGNALFGRGGLVEDAADCYFQAIALNPAFVDAYANLANATNELGKWDEAVEWCRRGLVVNPDYVELYNTMGTALRDLGQFAEAQAAFERALQLQPQHTAAHWNLALILLVAGDYSRGFAEYEWRWRLPPLGLRRALRKPLWDGSDLSGKTILLQTEQGFGDAIHFVRFVPMVAARGGKIVVSCQPALIELFRQIRGVEKVVSSKEAPPEHDVQQSMMSLPTIFKTTLESIPHNIPYLHANAEHAAKWKLRVTDLPGRKIGIAWAGSVHNPEDKRRSLQLSDLAAFANIDGISWISLQKGEPTSQWRCAALKAADWTDELTDFSQTAGLIENLDLVITADTAVAHLAGALGKPVWVFLPTVPDWRWLLDRADSVWYPTMRLFRQTTFNDWNAPVLRVLDALAAL